MRGEDLVEEHLCGDFFRKRGLERGIGNRSHVFPPGSGWFWFWQDAPLLQINSLLRGELVRGDVAFLLVSAHAFLDKTFGEARHEPRSGGIATDGSTALWMDQKHALAGAGLKA